MEILAALGTLLGGAAAILAVVSTLISKKNEHQQKHQEQMTQEVKERQKENIDTLTLTLTAMQSHIRMLTDERSIDRETIVDLQRQILECTKTAERLVRVEERLAKYEQQS